MTSDIVIFKEIKIKDAIANKPLETNFERNSMKKLMENRFKKKSSNSRKTKKLLLKLNIIRYEPLYMYLKK